MTVELIVLQCKSKNEGLKEMHSLAIARFYLPGEAQFPLNAMYSRPANKQEEGMCKLALLLSLTDEPKHRFGQALFSLQNRFLALVLPNLNRPG